MAARYLLVDVKKLVADAVGGNNRAVWFSIPNNSLRYVDHMFSCGDERAQDIVFEGLQKLHSNDFSKQTHVGWYPNIIFADKYGLQNFYSHNWYVKLSITTEDGETYLNSISFHPAEDELKTADGRTLKPTIGESDIPNWRKEKKTNRKDRKENKDGKK